MNKRGISPILSTVLLVGFTIALAMVVSNFLIQQTEEKFNPENIITESEFCDSVSLGYKVEIDVNDGSSLADAIIVSGDIYRLKFVNLTNKGTFTIKNITVIGPDNIGRNINIIQTDNNENILDSTVGLAPQENKLIKILFSGYNPSKENLVKIIPWIKDPKKNTYVLCADSALVIDIASIKKP